MEPVVEVELNCSDCVGVVIDPEQPVDEHAATASATVTGSVTVTGVAPLGPLTVMLTVYEP